MISLGYIIPSMDLLVSQVIIKYHLIDFKLQSYLLFSYFLPPFCKPPQWILHLLLMSLQWLQPTFKPLNRRRCWWTWTGKSSNFSLKTPTTPKLLPYTMLLFKWWWHLTYDLRQLRAMVWSEKLVAELSTLSVYHQTMNSMVNPPHWCLEYETRRLVLDGWGQLRLLKHELDQPNKRWGQRLEDTRQHVRSYSALLRSTALFLAFCTVRLLPTFTTTSL